LPAQTPHPPTPNAPILYFGRLSPEKGVSDLLRALRYVPTLRLKIAGDGPSRVDREELARRIELKNVGFVGHLPASELDELIREHHSPAKHYEAMTELYERLATRTIQKEMSRVVTLVPATSKPRLRVAFIGGRGVIGKYSGIESYYEEVGRRLAAMGHEVTVYCRTFFTPLQSEHNGMRLVRLPTVRSKHFETVLHTALSTLHVLFRPCDIVHYHTLGPALFSFIPRLVGKKTAVTVQGLDWQRKKWGVVARTVLRLGEKAALWCPDTTMVVSRTLWSYFREQYGAETRYVANGALLRERRPARRILEWGLRPEHYVLFLGRFSPEKNCHLLIEAYHGIDTQENLVLAGGGNPSDAYYQDILR